jgi:hypothetical protein
MITITVFSIILVQALFTFPIVLAPSEVEYGYCNENVDGFFIVTAGPVDEVGQGVHFSANEVVMISTNETWVKRIRVYTNETSLVWRILDWDEASNEPGTTIIANGTVSPPPGPAWFSFDISPIIVPSEFFVGFYNATPMGNVSIGYDNLPYNGRTRIFFPIPILLENNLMIRVVVEIPETIEDLKIKIGEPTGTVFSKLDEILAKLDEILFKMCPPIGGYILLPVALNENLPILIISLLSIVLVVLLKNRT